MEAAFGIVILLVLMIGLPLGLQGMLPRLSSGAATMWFIAYSAVVGLVFSSLIGVWLFNDRLSSLSWLGMGIIVTSSVAATLLRPKRKPASVAAANTPPAQK